MLFIKNKLNKELKISLENKDYKNYRVIIYYKNMIKNIENKIKTYRGSIIHSMTSINCICANLSPYAIERLIEYPQIKYITYDSYAFLCGKNILTSNKIFYKGNYKLTGKGIGVGIIDSGVYPHPDLLIPNNKIKKFVDLINNLSYPYDDNGHGTFISGLICGSGHLSKGEFKGIAENSHIYSIKAFNGLGRGFLSDILFGIQTLIEEKDTYNIKIICLPFEITNNNKFILYLFYKIFQIAVNNNITIIVPTGHNGNIKYSIKGIATLKNCITVGGLDTSSSIKTYKYSSCGPFRKMYKPDLVAACVNICSLATNQKYISERNGIKLYPTSLDKPYTTFTGTSCATAYICGICCLLYENNSELTTKDIYALLKTSCDLLTVPKWAQGFGMINIDKLLP